MREIEFRGKRIDNGEWVYGDLLQPTELCYIYEISDKNTVDGSRFEVNPETIGQYMGLKDKNGKKIFEGDIVKIDADRALITYSDEYSGYILKPIGEYYFDSPILAENMDLGLEVIGNIYDNIELLGRR